MPSAEQLTKDFQDRKLRIVFDDGEVAEVKLLLVGECDEHQDCRGIVYDVIASSRPDRFKPGPSYWTELQHIKTFEVIGD